MNENGFTLIESIIVLVMLSFTALIVVMVMDAGLLKSSDPLKIQEGHYGALKAIEIVNADYRTRLSQNPDLDISFYVGNLSAKITGLGTATVTGQYMGFSDPDSQRNVSETSAASGPYVKIRAVENQVSLVTIIGN